MAEGSDGEQDKIAIRSPDLPDTPVQFLWTITRRQVRAYKRLFVGGILVSAILWFIAQFLQARGVVSLGLSRVFLYAAALCVVLFLCLVIQKPAGKLIAAIFVIVLALATDWFTPKPQIKIISSSPTVDSHPSDQMSTPLTQPNPSTTITEKPKPLQNAPLKEQAHIRIEEPRVSIPEIKDGALVYVSTYCRNITSTIVPAKEVFCPSKFNIVILTNGTVNTKDQEDGYKAFVSSLPAIRPKKGGGPTIFPPEAQWGTATATLNERAARLLNTGEATIISFAMASFKDDIGPHKTESCFWLQPPITNPNPIWHVCSIHTGIRY
jgi:hypothetical protein